VTNEAAYPDEAEPTSTPYVGLVPYAESDAPFFFGRDREKRVVGGNLRASALTLLYGASGVGKTSLLRAGVVHDLRGLRETTLLMDSRRAPFTICVFSGWRDDPLPGLMETIRKGAAEALGGGDLAPWSPGEDVADALRGWTEKVRTLLVILDQFEDYFLYHPEEEGPGTFAEEFPKLVNDENLRVHFLVSIREDALAKLDRFKGSIPRLFANYVRVEHLDRSAAHRAIEGPVEEWNRRHGDEPPYTLEPGLVDAVIDASANGELALVRNGTRPTTAPRTDGGVEAPFLQLVMERIWRDAAAAGEHDLTVARLEALGGPQRIVENHLLEALGALSTEEQAVAADLFRFLVTRSKTKIAHPASDLAEWTGRNQAEATTVLEKLSRPEGGRILRRVPPPVGAAGETRYELFHDVLADPILEWRREYEQDVRRKRAIRRVGRIAGALAVLLAIVGSLGIWALIQRAEARTATRSATSLALASTAATQLPTRPDTALLLGLEAYRSSPTPEAQSALLSALEAVRLSGVTAILRGGADGVRTIAVSRDGSTLAAADFDGTVRLFDLQERKPIGQPFRAHTAEIWGLAFSPDGETLASSSFDGSVRFWHVDDQSPVGDPIEPGTGAVLTVAFAPDGRTIALGSGRSVQLWQVDPVKRLSTLQARTGSVHGVAFSPDGTMLAAGSGRVVQRFDARTGKPLGDPSEGHDGTVTGVVFSPDGDTIASGGLDGDVRIWSAKTGAPIGGPLDAGSGQVWGVSFSPDGKTLASSGFDRTVRLWTVETGKPLGDPLEGHTRAVIAVAYRPDGTLASSSYDGTVRLWDPAALHRLGDPIGTHDDRVTAVSVSPDGSTVASGSHDRTVGLWNASEAGPEAGAGRRLDGELDAVEDVAYGPDGSRLAAGDAGGSIWIWEDASGAPTRVDRDASVQSIAFDGDGSTIAAGDADGSIRLWDVSSAEERGEPLRGHEDPVWSVVLSEDGNTLVSAGSDGTVRVWDTDRHEEVGRLPLAEGDVVLAVALAPDGHTLGTGSVGGAVRLWDLASQAPLGEPIEAHAPENVESIAFSADGKTVATGGGDGSIRLWSVPDLRSLGQPLRRHAGAVNGVAFGPDGDLVSGGADGTVRLWAGILGRDITELEREVCGLVVGNLSKAEWDELAPGIEERTTCPT
jgi:WD40 repeat protein